MIDKEEERIIVPRFEAKNGYLTTIERSNLMSKIKGKNTKPEMLLRKVLWEQNIRYRLHNKRLPGNPDIVNKTYKFAIFVDGEFWHGFEWEKKREKIKTNRTFWIPKIERNIQRDIENNKKLESLGFKVFRFWEKQIKKNMISCIEEIKTHMMNINKKMAYKMIDNQGNEVKLKNLQD
jgi:DNA mismatch endonuclease (patch repair protein)